MGVTHFIGKDRSPGLDISLGYQYAYLKNTDINNTYRTVTRTRAESSSTNNYDLAMRTNALTLGVGFHWFINPKNKG